MFSAPARSKHLHLPHILSKLVPSVSLTSLVRGLHHNSSRTATPTPFELQPIYEAESPDELALVDAACAYNCKLLRRSPNHAVVSLPGNSTFLRITVASFLCCNLDFKVKAWLNLRFSTSFRSTRYESACLLL